MDPIIRKIINEIAEEEGIKVDHVELSVNNVCDWTREMFISKEYVSIFWPRFGSFTLIEKRLKDENEIEKVKEFKKLKKKKNNDEKEAN